MKIELLKIQLEEMIRYIIIETTKPYGVDMLNKLSIKIQILTTKTKHIFSKKLKDYLLQQQN